MGKLEELLYDIGGGILGILVMISFSATAYAHLWLQRAEGPLTDIAVVLSEDVEAEMQTMHDIRLLGLVFSIALICIFALFSVRYFQLKDDPAWEMKKSLGAGVFALLSGSTFFIISSDVFPQSLGLSLIALGILGIVGNTITLLTGMDRYTDPTS